MTQPCRNNKSEFKIWETRIEQVEKKNTAVLTLARGSITDTLKWGTALQLGTANVGVEFIYMFIY